MSKSTALLKVTIVQVSSASELLWVSPTTSVSQALSACPYLANMRVVHVQGIVSVLHPFYAVAMSVLDAAAATHAPHTTTSRDDDRDLPRFDSYSDQTVVAVLPLSAFDGLSPATLTGLVRMCLRRSIRLCFDYLSFAFAGSSPWSVSASPSPPPPSITSPQRASLPNYSPCGR